MNLILIPVSWILRDDIFKKIYQILIWNSYFSRIFWSNLLQITLLSVYNRHYIILAMADSTLAGNLTSFGILKVHLL